MDQNILKRLWSGLGKWSYWLRQSLVSDLKINLKKIKNLSIYIFSLCMRMWHNFTLFFDQLEYSFRFQWGRACTLNSKFSRVSSSPFPLLLLKIKGITPLIFCLIWPQPDTGSLRWSFFIKIPFDKKHGSIYNVFCSGNLWKTYSFVLRILYQIIKYPKLFWAYDIRTSVFWYSDKKVAR